VLYLDDEEPLVKLTSRLLTRLGFRVTGFTRAEDALEAVRRAPHDFDLALTDFNMPVMSGLQVAELLKSIRADLPVLLVSGYVTDELRDNAARAGVRQVIYKPNTVDELCNAVYRFVHSERTSASEGAAVSSPK
jgi:CheY-like chemotaxis protein